MMQRRNLLLGACTASLLFGAPAAHAQLAIRATTGTTGVGGDISVGILPRLALRAGASFVPVKPEGTFSDVSYRLDLPTPLFSAGADLYLLGGVRLMGGVLVGADEALITGLYNGSVSIGGTQYDGQQLGTLNGTVTGKQLAPFAGIGFGKTVGPGLGLSLDIGGAWLGQPVITLSADGTCTQISQCNTQLQQSLRTEEAEIQQSLDKYGKVLPMVSLGLRLGL